MKIVSKLFLLLFFLFNANKVSAQVPSGLWQADSEKISSGYLDCYLFGEKNTFSYIVNKYNALSRIVSLSGTYSIANGVIEFTILKSKERVGRSYFRDHTSSHNDSWALDDYKIVEFEAVDSVDEATIKILSATKISIDGRFFFKIKEGL